MGIPTPKDKLVNQHQKRKMPLKYKIPGVFGFGSMMFIAFYIFSNYLYELIYGMLTFQPVIEFSKGNISAGGFGLSGFALFMLALFAEKMPSKVIIFFFQVMFYGFLISLISPYLMMFWVDHFVEENHYIYCEAISDHEGKYWTTAYTKTTDICQIETAKVKNN